MRSAAPRAFVIALVPTLLLLGCGGGGGGGGADPLQTTILAAAEYDGVTDVSGLVAFDPFTAGAVTGDLEATYRPGYKCRQLYAFSLGTPPDGVRVLRAELRLWQGAVRGAPYEKNGDVVVDHVDYIPDPGPATYDDQNLTRDIGTLSTTAALGLRTLDVTQAVRADVAAGRPWSQFRLRFYTDLILPIIDHANDYAQFTTAEGIPDGDLPLLVITFEQ